MSFELGGKVIEDPDITDRYEFTVMVAIAEATNRETMTAYPSLSRISRVARCTRRQVIYVLSRLEKKGWITVIRRCEGGEHSPNLYQITKYSECSSPVVNTIHQVVKEVPHRVVNKPTRGGEQRAPEPIREPKEEKKEKPTRRLAADISSIILPLFLDTKEFRTALSHWADHKKLKRDPMTQHAIDLLVQRCETMGHDRAIAAIDYSIARGWRGVFEPKEEPTAANGSKPQNGDKFVTWEMVAEYCHKKGLGKRVADFAWGKLMSGRYYGTRIDNTADFRAAMAAIGPEFDRANP
jgi:hypothetical protein